MEDKKIFSYIAIFLWLLLLALGVYLYVLYDISLEQLIFWAKNYVLAHPFTGIVLFIFLYSIRPLFFIIATPFDIFSGMVFGPVYWFFISLLACFFSSMFSYGVGRITGPWVPKIRKKKHKSKKQILRNKLHEDTFFTALMMRFLLLPYDLTNYICWVMRAPFFPFIAGTTIGIAPATFVIVSAGSAFHGKEVTNYQTLLENIKYENLWFASGFFITILLVSQILRRKFKSISL